MFVGNDTRGRYVVDDSSATTKPVKKVIGKRKAVTVNESLGYSSSWPSEITEFTARELIFLDKPVLFEQKKEFSSKASMRLQ